MRILLTLFAAMGLLAQPTPQEAQRAFRCVEAFGRARRLEAKQGEGRWVWGQDPVSHRWEALALLDPAPGSKEGMVVRVHERRPRSWSAQRVCPTTFSAEEPRQLTALSAGTLADTWCPPLLPGQQGGHPAAPIEFHLVDEDGPSTSMIFHPRLGLATVVNVVVDDSKDPAPRDQVWGTHARGESVDLPASAVHQRAIRLGRWRGRIWFRLDGDLYAICESGWRVLAA